MQFSRIKLQMVKEKDFTYTINGIENQNIIIVYKDDLKTEFFEIELFEIA